MNMFTCVKCDKVFSRRFTLQRHQLKKHPNSPSTPRTFTCIACNYTFNRIDNYKRHASNVHTVHISNRKATLGASCFIVEPNSHCVCAIVFLDDAKAIVGDELAKVLNLKGSRSIYMWAAMEVHFSKLDGSKATGHFTHKKVLIAHPTLISTSLDNAFSQIRNNLEIYEQRGSGWTIDSIDHLDVHYVPFTRY